MYPALTRERAEECKIIILIFINYLLYGLYCVSNVHTQPNLGSEISFNERLALA